jgi:pyruvate/2-oxoglutarate dehydrogenase complex dihydrolipoamide acyltransferase (E2) component
VKMPRIRLRTAERLLKAQHITTSFNEIDMSSLISLHASSKESVLANYCVKLGFMGAFARACALVPEEIPVANAYIVGEDIVYRDYLATDSKHKRVALLAAHRHIYGFYNNDILEVKQSTLIVHP